MGGGDSTPSGTSGGAPIFNYSQAAQDQTKSNVDTAVANATLGNTNQVTPYGSLTYTENGGRNINGNWVPSYTATQTLSPTQQAIFDRSQKFQTGALDLANNQTGKISAALDKPYDFSGLPALPTDQTALRDKAYDSIMGRFNTDFTKSQAATDTNLRNQGLQPGTDAYNTQMDILNRTRTDAQQQAFINSGTVAQQDLQQAQTLRNQGINEMTQQRAQPVNEWATLAGLGGGVTQPTWAAPSAGQVQGTDVGGMQLAAYQGQLNAYNQQRASQNQMMGGLFGLGGSVAGGLARSPGIQNFFGLGA